MSNVIQLNKKTKTVIRDYAYCKDVAEKYSYLFHRFKNNRINQLTYFREDDYYLVPTQDVHEVLTHCAISRQDAISIYTKYFLNRIKKFTSKERNEYADILYFVEREAEKYLDKLNSFIREAKMLILDCRLEILVSDLKFIDRELFKLDEIINNNKKQISIDKFLRLVLNEHF